MGGGIDWRAGGVPSYGRTDRRNVAIASSSLFLVTSPSILVSTLPTYREDAASFVLLRVAFVS